MLKNQFLIALIIILIVILTIYWYRNSYELFDQKITNSTEENCGKMCTKVYGCGGFSSYNDICYLSKNPILGRPERSVFTTEYKNNITRCNKISKVIDPITATNDELKKNATYVCMPDDTGKNEKLKMYINNEVLLNNINDLDKINIDTYTFDHIDWGNTISLDNNKYLTANPTKDNSVIIMKEYNPEFLGQYMYKHKCVKDISQRDCLNNCIKNDKCRGTEWNPVYFRKNNDNTYDVFKGICCPKIQIKKIIPRRDKFKYGNFYLKDRIIKDNLKTDDIIITTNKD